MKTTTEPLTVADRAKQRLAKMSQLDIRRTNLEKNLAEHQKTLHAITMQNQYPTASNYSRTIGIDVKSLERFMIYGVTKEIEKVEKQIEQVDDEILNA